VPKSVAECPVRVKSTSADAFFSGVGAVSLLHYIPVARKQTEQFSLKTENTKIGYAYIAFDYRFSKVLYFYTISGTLRKEWNLSLRTRNRNKELMESIECQIKELYLSQNL